MPAPRLLSTYLRDHHAGAVAGAQLARRAAGQGDDAGPYRELSSIADEIEADKRSLEALMEALGVGTDRLKDVAAAAGERLGRLKPNGRWRDYSPLSRLLELEGLVIGVSAKLSLWRNLRGTLGDRVEGIDLVELESRAEDQRSRLEGLVRSAADAALDSD